MTPVIEADVPGTRLVPFSWLGIQQRRAEPPANLPVISDRSHPALGSYSSTTAERAWIGPRKRVSSSCLATIRRGILGSPAGHRPCPGLWHPLMLDPCQRPLRPLQSYRQSLLPLVDGGTLDAVAATGALAGRINGYPTPSRAFGLTIDSWACSNFLVVAGTSLARLGDLVTVGTTELASVVNHSVAEGPLLQADGPLDDALIGYLTEWLTGVGTALTDHWYRHRPATADSWDDLCGKVQSILNEQLLSAKARRAGIPVLPLASAWLRSFRTNIALLPTVGRVGPRTLPRGSPRLLGGLAGRNLVAMHRWRQRRRPLAARALERPAWGRCLIGSPTEKSG